MAGFLLIAIGVMSIPPSILVADEPEFIPVFPAGLSGVARYRIPGVVVTPKGTVLAYCEARLNDSSDWGEIEIHLRRSLDGGRTWQPAQHIAHHGERLEGNPRKKSGGEREQTVNNPVAIVDAQTGAIEFIYCVNYARCYSMRSMDDGETWSKPVEMTRSFEPFRMTYDWKVIATGPGHGLQLTSGRLVVPIWLAYGNTGDHEPSAAGTIYSDDHGRTWKAGDIAVRNSAPFTDPNESMVATLSDGSVILITRNEGGRHRKIVSTSRDGATDWSEPRFAEELWEPVCMASVASLSDHPGWLLFSNPDTLPPSHLDLPPEQRKPGRGKRENLTIKLSRDDGRSWPVRRTLDAGPSAYSDLAVLPDKTILCLYEASKDITIARFSLDWIEGR
ncbi:MAG: exo-alpha-sialidase [Planctomycetota bacterium]